MLSRMHFLYYSLNAMFSMNSRDTRAPKSFFYGKCLGYILLLFLYKFFVTIALHFIELFLPCEYLSSWRGKYYINFNLEMAIYSERYYPKYIITVNNSAFYFLPWMLCCS